MSSYVAEHSLDDVGQDAEPFMHGPCSCPTKIMEPPVRDRLAPSRLELAL